MNDKYIRTESEKNSDKITLNLIVVIIIAVIFTEIVSYYKTQNFELDIFTPVIGLIIWFAIYLNSQRVIDKNLFKEIFILSIGVFTICFLKQVLTKFNNIGLIISAIPLIYISYFKILIRLFYKNYPDSMEKPTIIFASQYSTSFRGKYKGYKPTMKEKIFSLLLYMGFLLFSLASIFISKKIGILG